MQKSKKPLIIIITGASSGIGLAVATHLAECGHIVYGTSRFSRDQAIFHWLKLDVTEKGTIEEAISKVLERHGRIDVLINNAGLGMVSALEESPRANVQKVMDTNFIGTLQMIQAVLPAMRDQRSGKIINISSIAGLMGLPYRSIYSASKFAVEGMTEALRTEVRKFNIEACTLEPGSIHTDIKSNRVSHVPPNSVYNPELANAEKLMNEEVEGGMNVTAVATEIVKILGKKHLKAKYIVAKPFQVIVARIKHFIPPTFFERLLMKHYGLRR